MTAVCIAGMHRSGTSMVTRLLNVSGLHLGPQADMMNASGDNPEGFWEDVKFVAINDELLAELGAGWDYPPPPQACLESEALVRLQRKAELIVQDFRDCELWGWKDPRTSVLADFWLSVRPDLKFVICVRHPFEVADSLARRNYFSRARSLSLWLEYNQRLLAATSADQRIITHYDAYFEDWQAELGRVLHRIGAPLSAEAVDIAAAVVRSDLRHNRAHAHQLLDSGVPAGVFDLYMQMCNEAGWRGTCGGGPLEDMHLDDAQSAQSSKPLDVRRLEARVAQLTAEVQTSEARLVQCMDELLVLRHDLEMLQTSVSWRSTAPLRWISARLPKRAATALEPPA